MAPEDNQVNTKEVLLSGSSSADETIDSPVGAEKRKSTHTSSASESSDSDDESIRRDSYSGNGEQEGVLSRIVSRQQTRTLSKFATNRTGVSVATNGTTDPSFEVDFAEDDPSNPRNWPFWYRGCIIFFISFSTLTVVMYSTSYTSAIPGIKSDFGISSDTVPVLGITTYMIGLSLGSVVLAPLSEMCKLFEGSGPVLVYCSSFETLDLSPSEVPLLETRKFKRPIF
jgi:hypothetical protein